MSYRNPNDAVDIAACLSALGQVMAFGSSIVRTGGVPTATLNGTANTVLGQQGGSILVNNREPLESQVANWPALLIEEDQTITVKQDKRAWKKHTLVKVTYYARFDQNSATLDSQWADVDLDLRRMVANIEDNSGLLLATTRYAERISKVTLSPYGSKSVTQEDFGPCVERQAMIQVDFPSYTTLA